MRKGVIMTDYMLSELTKAVRQKGLKYTKQRELVLEAIYENDYHLSAEEIYNLIKQKYENVNIGIATVYRSLTFLEESSLVSSVNLGQNLKKYEPNFKDHHDHLICIKCSKVIEFCDDTIERRQERIAKTNNFKLLNHKMYLYGICKECQ